MMGPYWGGQAEYLRVPWADFNLLELPPGTEHETDFTMLSDIFPTGYHGTDLAQVSPGGHGGGLRRRPGRADGCAQHVGYQAHDPTGQEHPEMVLDKLVEVVRATGRLGVVGQCPVKRYNRQLRDLIIRGRAKPSIIVSHELPLDQAPKAYDQFDKRVEGWTKVLLHPAA